MLLFCRRKDELETAGRKAFLDYLKSLEKRNCIQWSYRENYIVRNGVYQQLRTVVGKSGKLNIGLTYRFHPSYIHRSGQWVHQQIFFQSLTVSLEDDGMLILDKKTAPKHWYFCLDPRITYLIKRAVGQVEKRQKTQVSLENREKIVEAERAAHLVLHHMP